MDFPISCTYNRVLQMFVKFPMETMNKFQLYEVQDNKVFVSSNILYNRVLQMFVKFPMETVNKF